MTFLLVGFGFAFALFLTLGWLSLRSMARQAKELTERWNRVEHAVNGLQRDFDGYARRVREITLKKK